MGFGKTTFLHQLVKASNGIYVASADEIEAASDRLAGEPTESMLVAIDNASRWAAEALLLAEDPAINTLVIADRYLAPELVHLAEQYELLQLTAHELRFTEDEMHELAEQLAPVSGTHPPMDGPPDLAERVAYVLGTATEGWPEAVVWMLHRSFTSGDPLRVAKELSFPGPDADAFLDRHLAGLPEHLQDAIASLAHFEAFTGSCIDTLVGQDGPAQARRAGAPFLKGERGWYRMPGAISRPLQARGPLDASTAQQLAPVLIASGGILAGLRAMIRADCIRDAAQAVESLPPQRLDEVDQQGLIDVVATMRLERDNAHLALTEARAHRNLGDHPASDRCLDQCMEMGSSVWKEDPVNAEIVLGARIDRLFGKAFTPSPETDRDIAELRSLIKSHMSPALSLRLDEIDALLRGQMADPAIVDQACEDALSVAKRWENLGEISFAVTAVRKICNTGLSHLGRYEDGIRALEHAHSLSWHRLRDRTLNLNISCRLRALAGDIDTLDAAVREASALAQAIGHSWVEGYLHWTEAIIASRRGDDVKILKHLLHAERALGTLMEHETGVQFHCEAAVALAEVGLLDEAADHLGRIEHQVDFENVEFGLASATVAARRGQRDQVTAILAALDRGGRLPPGRKWRATLEASIAADLSGDAESATRLRSTALADAERHDQARLAALLLQAAPTLGATTAVLSRPTLRIDVLGAFSVEREGEAIDVPDGHVMVLLKLLAINEGPVPAEVVFDVLWPGADASLGRRRIKNIVARLRSLIGSEHVVRTNETLALGPTVEVDVRSFEHHVRRGLSADLDAGKSVAHLMAALELYRGIVLPTDLYDDWAGDVRQSTSARALTILDQLFDQEPEHRPSTAWLLDVLLRVDAEDDGRLLRITRQALAEGHHACARAALERALAAAQDLGVSLEDQISDLRFLLKTA